MVRLLTQTTYPPPAEVSAPEDLVADGLEVPFSPSRTQVAPLADRVMLVSRVLDWGERRRLPLGLLFSLLIGVAAFSAYQAQHDESGVQAGSTAGTGVNHQIGPLAAAVDGITASDDAEAIREGAQQGDPGQIVVSESEPAVGPDKTSSSTQVPSSGSTPTDSSLGASHPPTTSASSSKPSTAARPPGTSKAAVTTAKPTTTTKPTTTAQPATTQKPATTPPPTTPPATAPTQPVTIGGRVDTSGSWGVWGTQVALYYDREGDGVGDVLYTTAGTNFDGSFSFAQEPGCYVVRVLPPAGYSAVAGQEQQSTCLTSGQQRADLALAITATVAAPHYCEVQIGWSPLAGVEIQEPGSAFAASYVFYDQFGTQLHDTASFGPPDDVEPQEPSIEWTSLGNGFEESLVYSVAAKSNQGQISAPTTCARLFVR